MDKAHDQSVRLNRRLSARVTAVLWAAVILLFGQLVMSGWSSAHYGLGHYTYGNSSCTDGSDPTNVLFTDNATQTRSVNHLESHTGWTEATVGTDQWILDNGTCDRLNYDSASGEFEERYHIRVEPANDSDPTYGTMTVASAHWEEVNWCPTPRHEVTEDGFDEGKWEVENAMDNSHSTKYVYWGNIADFAQSCGNWEVGSSGYVAYIDIN